MCNLKIKFMPKLDQQLNELYKSAICIHDMHKLIPEVFNFHVSRDIIVNIKGNENAENILTLLLIT